jgi:hypothetical protein
MSLGSRTEIPAPGYSLTKGRKPKTGEAKLMVQYRCGYVDKWPYTSAQLRWDDTGHAWDVVAVRKA